VAACATSFALVSSARVLHKAVVSRSDWFTLIILERLILARANLSECRAVVVGDVEFPTRAYDGRIYRAQP
jgi:hypothetical protein